MSAPVTVSPNSPTAPAASAAAGSTVSLNPSGSSLFGSMLSFGMANFTMSKTAASATSAESASTASSVANSDTKLAAGQTGVSLEPALLLTPEELSAMSKEDWQAIVENFGDTTDDLTPSILISLTPGVPAKDVIENINAQFSRLEIDPTKFAAVSIATTGVPTAPIKFSALSTPAVTDTTAVADGTLTVNTTDADAATNLLLMATDLSPSEMSALKDAIKAASNPDDADDLSADQTDLTDVLGDDTAAANMVLVLMVAPTPKPIEAAAPQDISFDLSSLSAFTQTNGSDMEEPDWTKKLSDKLSGMSLSDDASPFDAEMDDILAFKAPKSEADFQGSIASTAAHAKKEADTSTSKSVSGELSPQATLAQNNFSTIPAAALQNLTGDSLLMANGNMLATQQNMASPLSNPIFTSSSAIGTHPSVQAVAVMIEKAASGSEKAKQELSVQLDPPELGRMQVQLSMEKGGSLKVHLLAEKEETLSLFQRDSHALKSALDNAGIQVDSGSLTFDLASGDQSFNQLLGGSQQDNQSNGNSSRSSVIVIDNVGASSADAHITETKMDFLADKVTGNIHYSFWA